MFEQPKGGIVTKPDNKIKASAEYRARNIEKYYSIAIRELGAKVHELGILETAPEGVKIFHEDRFLDFFSANRKSEKTKVIAFLEKNIGANQSLWAIVFDYLLSQKAVSAIDYDAYQKSKNESTEPNPKVISVRPLLHIPIVDGVVNEKTLKENDSLVDFLSLPINSRTLSEVLKKRFGVSSVDYQLLVTLYDKRHGDGKRDDEGRLLVKDIDGEYKLVGEELITRISGSRIAGVRFNIKNGIYPVTVENKLLSEDDLRQKQKRESDLSERLERKIRTKGMVFVGGATYILGANFEGRTLIKLQEGIYGILSDSDTGRRITHVLRTLGIDEIQRRRQLHLSKTGKELHKAGLYVGIKEVDLREFSVTDFVEPYPNKEDVKGYADRVSRYSSNYNDIREVTNRVSERTNIPIFKLSFGEQLRLVYLVGSGKEETERLYSLGEKFGLSGLRTLLSIDFGKENLNVTSTIADNLDHDSAQKIFELFSSIIDSAERASEYLSSNFSNFKSDERALLTVKESLLLQAKNLLASFASDIERAKRLKMKISSEDIKSKLENINVENALFLASFKTVAESGQNIEIEDIKNAEFISCRGGELSMDEQGEMIRMYMDNYSQFPKLRDYLVKNFRGKMSDPNTVFRIFKHNGAIVGYYREDLMSNGNVYFGSFNIAPRFQGSKIGETILKNKIDQTASERVIEADVIETMSIAGNYIERGFIGISHAMYEDAPGIKIVRNDDMNHRLKTKSKDFIAPKIGAFMGELKNSDDGSFAYIDVYTEDIQKVPFGILNKMPDQNHSWVLTRYTKEKVGKKSVTRIFFEKVKKDFVDEYRHRPAPYLKSA